MESLQISINGHSVSLPDDLLDNHLFVTQSPPMPGDDGSNLESLVVAHREDQRWSRGGLFPLPRGPNHPARGLLPVFHVLAQSNPCIEIQSNALAQLPTPLQSYTKTGLGEFVFEHDLGLIRYRRKWHCEAEVAKELGLRFPHQRIVILADKVEDLRSLTAELRKTFRQDVGCIADWREEAGPRIALARFSDWNSGVTEISKADIVLLLMATDVMSLRATNALYHPDHRFRLYGLLPFAAKMSRETADRVVAAFGFHQHWLANGISQWRPRSVTWQPLHIQFDCKGKREFDVRKAYFWGRARDERVQRLARQLATGSSSTKAQGVLTGFDDASLRIVLLSSQERQARRFAERLGWSLSTGDPSRNLIARTNHTVLMPGAIQNCVPKPDIVINSASVVPDLPAHWFTMPTRDLRPIKIVDFNDVGCSVAKRWARQRKFTYEALDIFEQNLDPVAARLRRFVESRPRPRRSAGVTA